MTSKMLGDCVIPLALTNTSIYHEGEFLQKKRSKS